MTKPKTKFVFETGEIVTVEGSTPLCEYASDNGNVTYRVFRSATGTFWILAKGFYWDAESTSHPLVLNSIKRNFEHAAIVTEEQARELQRDGYKAHLRFADAA